MTLQETAGIMTILHTAYPHYYANATDEEKKAALNLWSTMFDDYDYNTVAAAVKAVIATSKFPPTVADINEKLRLLTMPQSMGETEAWCKVRKAICNGYYNSREEFEKLPDECKAIVHAPEQLKAWSQISEDELNTVVASYFMRDFRNNEIQRKEKQMLPSSVKAIMGDSNTIPQIESAT